MRFFRWLRRRLYRGFPAFYNHGHRVGGYSREEIDAIYKQMKDR